MSKNVTNTSTVENNFPSRPFLFFCFFMVISLETVICQTKYSGSFLPIDTDPYMRMVRVETLLNGGDWYDQSIAHSNAPFGEELHWSRAFDLLLILVMMPFSLFFDQHTALQWSGMLISPLLKMISLPALFWASRPVLSKANAFRACLLFLSQWGIIQYDSFSRPDHHSLLFLLFILFLGAAFRSLQAHNMYMPYYAGLISAISTWVSVESLVGIAIWLLILYYCWIKDGQTTHLLILKKYLSTISFLLSFFMIVEQPISKFTMPVYDKISFVHCVIFTLLFLQTLLLAHLSQQKNIKRRFLQFSSLSLLVCVIINHLFPLFFHGPFAMVNREVVSLWLSKVNEIQPLSFFPLEKLNTTIIFMGPVIFAIIYIISFPRCYIITRSNYLNFLLLSLFVFSVLAFRQIRWSPYAEIIILFYNAMLLEALIKKASTYTCHMQKFIVQLTAYCFVSAGHILLTLLIAFLWIPTPAIGEQQISLHDLNQSTLSSKESAVILTDRVQLSSQK